MQNPHERVPGLKKPEAYSPKYGEDFSGTHCLLRAMGDENAADGLRSFAQ
jgi:hypothetical protein